MGYQGGAGAYLLILKITLHTFAPGHPRPTGPLWTLPSWPKRHHSLRLEGVGGVHRLLGAQETHCV